MPTSSARSTLATNRQSVQTAVFLAGMVASLCLLAGCFVVDATLNADGSGTISYTYPVRPDATVESEKPRFSSAHVTAQSLTIGADRRATLKAAFDDATKLDTVAGFKTVAVTRKREGDNEELQIVINNPDANPSVKDQGLEGPQIAINLPGKVVDATPKADIDGNTVAWKLKLVDFMRSPKTTLTIRYATGGAAAAPKDQAGSKKSD